MSNLFEAARQDNVAQIKSLLDSGADVNEQDGYGTSALMEAVGYAPSDDAALLLIERGANLDAKMKDGTTTLMLAAIHGYAATAQLLVEKGADVDAQDRYGRTALMLAAHSHSPSVIPILINGGANLNLRNKTGKTSSVIAKKAKCTEAVEMLRAAGATE